MGARHRLEFSHGESNSPARVEELSAAEVSGTPRAHTKKNRTILLSRKDLHTRRSLNDSLHELREIRKPSRRL